MIFPNLKILSKYVIEFTNVQTFYEDCWIIVEKDRVEIDVYSTCMGIKGLNSIFVLHKPVYVLVFPQFHE